jgi:regulator of replication initiation timing
MPKQLDTPIKKNASSVNIRTEFSINDVMKLLKSIEEKHDSGLKSINNKLTFYEKNFTSLKSSLDSLVISFNNLKTENDLLKTELKDLRDKVKLIDSVDSKKMNFVNEVNDRLSRSRNVLFFNISKDPEKTDDLVINDLISTMKLKVPYIGLQRLGNSTSNNTIRPLRITLNDTADVIALLKSKSKLRTLDKYKRIWINADLTRCQREHMKSLRQDLQLKRDAGENNWIIKYVNGMPSLCQKN